jgi:hypothetical protein
VSFYISAMSTWIGLFLTSLIAKLVVCMTNNYSRDDRFMALLSSWPLALQILFFTIGRVRVNEIEKEELGEVKG